MIELRVIRKFLWKKVCIGVPHTKIVGHLFWYSGQLVSASESNVVIRKNDGKLLGIALERIQEIYEDRYQ